MTSRGGLVWLAETADGAGLSAGLVEAMGRVPSRRHAPGRTLAQMVVALADGAECLSDLAVLGAQPAVLGPVPSQATVWRTFEAVGPAELAGIDTARARARERVWQAGAGPTGDELVIDLDSTVITTKSDKQDAAGTYKRTFGHHPLLAVCAETGEVLAGVMRPGNAGTSTAADHVEVLDAVIDQLPNVWADGHRIGDDPVWGSKNLLVRTEPAGASHWLAEECRARNISFSLGYAIDQWVRDALLLIQEEDWAPAIDGNGRARRAA